MPFDGGMVSVVAPRYVEPRQRVVKRKRDHALDRVDELVQTQDLARGAIVACRPWEDVGERDGKAERAAPRDDRGEVARRLLHGAPLRDIVDAALHDEEVGAVDDVVHERRDLVRAPAVDRARVELEARIALRRPPLPLTALVRLRNRRAHDRVRVPQRRAG